MRGGDRIRRDHREKQRKETFLKFETRQFWIFSVFRDESQPDPAAANNSRVAAAAAASSRFPGGRGGHQVQYQREMRRRKNEKCTV